MRPMNPTDRAIINGLQGGFPLSARPFREAGAKLGVGEDELIARIHRLVENGSVSRFGPLWNVERLGGAFCLCAMTVPVERFEAVARLVNAYPEVSQNYERSHALNMWFVVAAERPERIAEVIKAIEEESGLAVYPMPKTREFFVGFRVEV